MKLKTKQLLYILGIVAGIALMVTGIFLKEAELKALMGVFIGVGAGLIGMFIASLLTSRIETKHPQAFVKKNIEVNDERNTIIRDKAKAKTNSIIMLAIIPILTLVLILVNAELYVILALVGLILLNAGLYIGYFNYYNKRL
jgi:drug/metabolite transporter (DMT)-like permease